MVKSVKKEAVMINIFSSKKIKCFFCGDEHKEKDTHELEYNTENGTYVNKMCPRCADNMNKIIDIRDGIINE